MIKCKRLSILWCVIISLMMYAPNIRAEITLLLEITSEYGWTHNGVKSWGGNWHKRACNEALEEIRTSIANMLNLQELETFTKKDLDLSGKVSWVQKSVEQKIAYSESKNDEEKTRWINENNFLIDVSDVRIKPGTDWSKGEQNLKGERTWEASAMMLYTLRIFGKTEATIPNSTTRAVEDSNTPVSSGQNIQSNRDYHIQAQVSGLYLDVFGGNKDVGGRICQATKHPAQVWRFEPSENYPGYYYIQSQVSGLYLDVFGGNKEIGGKICQAVKHPDQVWKLE